MVSNYAMFFILTVLGLMAWMFWGVLVRQDENFRKSHPGFIDLKSTIYISGYDKIRPQEEIIVHAYDNRIMLLSKKLNSSETDSEFKITIPYENLRDVNVKTESEIKSSVTLSRLLMLGALAFFAKKNEENIDDYLIISFNENGITYDILLQQDASQSARKSEIIDTDLEKFAIKIRQAKWDYENKNNTTVQIEER